MLLSWMFPQAVLVLRWEVHIADMCKYLAVRPFTTIAERRVSARPAAGVVEAEAHPDCSPSLSLEGGLPLVHAPTLWPGPVHRPSGWCCCGGRRLDVADRDIRSDPVDR